MLIAVGATAVRPRLASSCGRDRRHARRRDLTPDSAVDRTSSPPSRPACARSSPAWASASLRYSGGSLFEVVGLAPASSRAASDGRGVSGPHDPADLAARRSAPRGRARHPAARRPEPRLPTRASSASAARASCTCSRRGREGDPGPAGHGRRGPGIDAARDIDAAARSLPRRRRPTGDAAPSRRELRVRAAATPSRSTRSSRRRRSSAGSSSRR